MDRHRYPPLRIGPPPQLWTTATGREGETERERERGRYSIFLFLFEFLFELFEQLYMYWTLYPTGVYIDTCLCVCMFFDPSKFYAPALSLSLSLSHTHTHKHMYTHAHLSWIGTTGHGM
jgi:hypothetical protein